MKIQIRIEKRNETGRKTTLEVDTNTIGDLKHADMKRLWEAEHTLNELLPGIRVHINVGD